MDPHEHDWSWGVEQVGWNEGFYDNDWTWHEGSNWSEAAVWNETKGSEESERHVDDGKNGSTMWKYGVHSSCDTGEIGFLHVLCRLAHLV